MRRTCTGCRTPPTSATPCTQIAPDMLFMFADEGIVDLVAAMDFRRRLAAEVPVLLVKEAVDEAAIGEALRLGAQDAVTLANASASHSW
jgi:hypothetical protein